MDGTSVSPTSPSPESPIPVYWGFIAVAVASVLFGSNLIPIKKFETGDGMFFQWILCSAIWLTAFVLNGIRLFPKFYPLAMVGGVLWCTGNVMVVPILKTIGISQGMLIWASLNMLAGWTTSRYGLLGLNADVPPHIILNYFGVVMCLVSAVIYMFLKTSNTPPSSSSPVSHDEYEPLLVGDASLAGVEQHVVDPTSLSQPIFYERLSPFARRLLGISMAVIAGILFGLNFTPVIYIQQHSNLYPGASTNGLDYVFAHFTGILATSTVYLVLYCAVMRNQPRIYPRAIVPGFISGLMWGVADIGWFIANDALSEPISFPIITSIPALIGAFWGIVLFGEIKGRRNYIILISAVVFAISGSVLTGLSKWDNSGHSRDNDTTASLTTMEFTTSSKLTVN